MHCISLSISSFTIAEVNECLSTPCQNGGKCKDLVNKYECQCATGYEGTNCAQGNVHDKIPSQEVYKKLLLTLLS